MGRRHTFLVKNQFYFSYQLEKEEVFEFSVFRVCLMVLVSQKLNVPGGECGQGSLVFSFFFYYYFSFCWRKGQGIWFMFCKACANIPFQLFWTWLKYEAFTLICSLVNLPLKAVQLSGISFVEMEGGQPSESWPGWFFLLGGGVFGSCFCFLGLLVTLGKCLHSLATVEFGAIRWRYCSCFVSFSSKFWSFLLKLMLMEICLGSSISCNLFYSQWKHRHFHYPLCVSVCLWWLFMILLTCFLICDQTVVYLVMLCLAL